MMHPLLLCVFFLFRPMLCLGDEIPTRFGVIAFTDQQLLISFNENVAFGQHHYLAHAKKSANLMEEVREKLETAVDETKSILEMFPEDLSFKIVLLPTAVAVRRVYREIYNTPSEFIAFYSPQKKTIFLSVNDVQLRVLIHEIAHVVMDFYFGVAPSVKIHEVLAQYAESHFAGD